MRLHILIWSHGTQWIACFNGCQLAMVCMSNRKDMPCKSRWRVLLARVWLPCCASPLSSCIGHVIHATSHIDHEKLSKHACGSVSIVTGLSLAELCCWLVNAIGLNVKRWIFKEKWMNGTMYLCSILLTKHLIWLAFGSWFRSEYGIVELN